MMCRFFGFLGVGLVASASSGAATVLYDSNGFDDFALGPLHGQDGWDAGWIALDPYVGQEPQIVDWGGGDLGIVIEVDEWGSYMRRSVGDVIAAGYGGVTVSFDVWRFSSDPTNDLWWYWESDADPFEMWGGGQGDVTEPVYATGSTPTLLDRFVPVSITWDFDAMTVSSTYDGVALGTAPLLALPSELTTFGFEMWAPPSGAHACIDEFVITAIPAPGVALGLAAGLVGFSGRRRRAM